jgi:hypothetical protein
LRRGRRLWKGSDGWQLSDVDAGWMSFSLSIPHNQSPGSFNPKSSLGKSIIPRLVPLPFLFKWRYFMPDICTSARDLVGRMSGQDSSVSLSDLLEAPEIIDSGQFSSCDIEQEADIEKYQKRMRELIESIDCWRFAHPNLL